jgi:kynureninase
LFVHSNWDEDSPKYAVFAFSYNPHLNLICRLHGWWGHDRDTRFLMPHKFSRIPGAAGYQQSNPGALLAATLMGSLELFERVPDGIAGLRRKSEQITAWLEHKLRTSKYFYDINSPPLTPKQLGERDGVSKVDERFTIITPSDPEARGAQLSLLWPAGEGTMQHVFIGLKRRGVIGDERDPDVIRLSPAPLYNSFGDCARAAEVLEEVLDEMSSKAVAAKGNQAN